MLLNYVILIMILSSVIGGMINCLLPSNLKDATGERIRPMWQCMLLGFGATFLVPLFLEIAQSKLLDEISHTDNTAVPTLNEGALIIKHDVSDIDTTQTTDNSEKIDKSYEGKEDHNRSSAKNYLLFSAYCLLASIGGFRFINMLLTNVIKQEEVEKLKAENYTLEKVNEKRAEISRISQEQEARKEFASNPDIIVPILPPVTNKDDPQKGRFGGKSEVKMRKLSAKVKEASLAGFYNVTLIVESTDPANNPLDTDVVFYLHDSFSPSVYTIKPDEFKDGKAIDDDILSYGAFTVGVVTDNGKTLLELDLALDPSFPKEFRAR